MPVDSKHELDETDMMIIQELVKDGRISIKHLAAKIGVCQRVARSRFLRLTGENIIRVVGFPVFPLEGITYPAFIGLNVQAGYRVDTIAKGLTELSHFGVVALATGPYDIVTWAVFNHLKGMSDFLKYELGTIPGIANSQILIHLETIKNVPACLPIKDNPDKIEPEDHRLGTGQKYIPDELDRKIIQELQKDGRLTAVELAKRVGINRINATNKLRNLLSTSTIQIVAVADTIALGYKASGRIGINVLPGTLKDVAQDLAALDTVHFVAITSGVYDLLIGVHFSDLQEWSDFIISVRNNIPGITKTDSMVYLRVHWKRFDHISTFYQHP